MANPAFVGSKSFLVSLSDTTKVKDASGLTYEGCTIFAATSGTVKVGYFDGSTDTITLAAGSMWPLRVWQVFSTGTTVTELHGIIY